MTAQDRKLTTQYRLEVLPASGEAIARRGNAIVASSHDAKIMYETRLPPAVYFPLEDVRAMLIDNPDHRTFCPFKGTASYWDVQIDGETLEKGAWCYRSALPESQEIEGYVGFMPGVLTELSVNGEEVRPQHYGNVSGPTVDWVMREAWLCGTPEELTADIARKFLEDGLAISRISVMIWSLHPMIAGKNYVWSKKDNEVRSYAPSYDIFNNPAFVNSPILHVSKGLGGVRQSLTTKNAEFSFPIMDELRAEGGTDYVAMPLPFSNGQINVMTLTCDHPTGFTTANLGLVFECSPVISRLYEVFALRDNASALLETYLGKRTGARVLGGEIRRGDGDHIDAAILFCDLRHSSRLAETLGREDYLTLLNGFFETTTQIVNAHDGEVLKFIGDAVLAIFPAGGNRQRACVNALESALEIERSLKDDERSDLDCSVGLAFGDVTYGNVGSRERLDFTVIGTAANIAARLSDLGKQLGHRVVASDHFSACVEANMRSLGRHDLHNVASPIEAFAPGR